MELKKAERIASESVKYARKSLQKSDELEAYLSMLEYRAGKVRTYRSARELIRAAKRS